MTDPGNGIDPVEPASSQTHGESFGIRTFLQYETARLNAIRLLRVESGLLVLLVVYLGISGIFKTVSAPGALIGEVVFGLLGAGALYISSNGFVQRKSFGRAPAVLANLIALGVSYFMFSGGLVVVAVPLSLLALATFLSALFGYKGN
jgi:hypothetical protein